MRIVYFDIESLRPDHLGCYGYLRPTSPQLDRLAEQGVRFENVFASDVPCLPSRTALASGRFGIHTGVVDHGGSGAEMFHEGAERGFESTYARTNWIRLLRDVGLRTVAIGPFAERHAAWHWCASWSEIHNTGRRGMERADEIASVACDWLASQGAQSNWFLHVNFWDLHPPYRTPEEFGDPFRDHPLPEWLTEEVRSRHWSECGPHSAREVNGFGDDNAAERGVFPRQPATIDSADAVRQLFDGYDTGVRYVDEQIGVVLDRLDELGVLDQTVVIVGSDHGVSLGEFNVYGSCQTADLTACRVPLIVRWPGITGAQAGRVEQALHYQFDFAATMIEMLGALTPENWDGISFADAFRRGEAAGRSHLVLSQAAGTCQRAVRFVARGRNYLFIRTWHDGFRGLPDHLLFDVDRDPHEQNDFAAERPDLVQHALALLAEWHGQMMLTSTQAVDPLWTVLREGGPYATRGRLEEYVRCLQATERERWAEFLVARHGGE